MPNVLEQLIELGTPILIGREFGRLQQKRQKAEEAQEQKQWLARLMATEGAQRSQFDYEQAARERFEGEQNRLGREATATNLATTQGGQTIRTFLDNLRDTAKTYLTQRGVTGRAEAGRQYAEGAPGRNYQNFMATFPPANRVTTAGTQKEPWEFSDPLNQLRAKMFREGATPEQVDLAVNRELTRQALTGHRAVQEEQGWARINKAPAARGAGAKTSAGGSRPGGGKPPKTYGMNWRSDPDLRAIGITLKRMKAEGASGKDAGAYFDRMKPGAPHSAKVTVLNEYFWQKRPNKGKEPSTGDKAIKAKAISKWVAGGMSQADAEKKWQKLHPKK